MMSLGNLQSQRANSYSHPPTNYKKMDILFYDTVNSMKQHHNFITMYHFLKALIFIVFIPIDYTVINSPNDSKIMAAMIIALSVSLLQAISLLIFRLHILRDNILLLRICQQMNHSVDEQINITDTKQLTNCVSQTMYNRQNQTLLSNQGLTEDMKKMYTNFLQSNLKQMLARETPCLSCFGNLTIVLGFAAIVYAIVALAIGEENKPQLILLIIYIVLECFTKMIILIGLLVVALLPVICCFGICFVCCCSRGNTQASLPKPQKVTQQMIIQADGTCSICYQNFIVDDSAIRLRCSPKHMFHPMCISGWTKLKQTCPICRAQIDSGREMEGNM